jgi:tRNA G18 (ribose-2'-O)-methylase SpoU
VEQAPSAKDYKSAEAKDKTVFIFGNEVDGVDDEILELCDEIVEIKMGGEKESLNVGVAVGIVLFNSK